MAGLKFRVLMDSETKNEVFRDIVIADNAYYSDLYKAIIEAFQFKGEEMASFYLSNDEWDKGEEIALEDVSFGDEEEIIRLMSNTLVRDTISEPDQKIILVYDFMRMWIFLIELIGYERETPDHARVVLSVGNAPAEESRSGDDIQGMMSDLEEDEDEFGFDDFDDDYSEDDYSNFNDYDY